MGQSFFSTKVCGIGEHALDFANERMVIFFNKKVQKELSDYSILIDDLEGEVNVEVGDFIIFADSKYKITAIGEVAIKNLRELGHCVVKFDGKTNAELPGNIHVENKEMPEIEKGMEIKFLKED
ncbi:MAG TPA: PTS glucitol/sorbitol transporter subunit IIA [Thermoanaerobacterales bacterium]|mgnify:FL=1|nr:PTS glucitol/sorbitol transporter subunit IIA [Thermoanaerobacterales bacterium]